MDSSSRHPSGFRVPFLRLSLARDGSSFLFTKMLLCFYRWHQSMPGVRKSVIVPWRKVLVCEWEVNQLPIRQILAISNWKEIPPHPVAGWQKAKPHSLLLPRPLSTPTIWRADTLWKKNNKEGKIGGWPCGRIGWCQRVTAVVKVRGADAVTPTLRSAFMSIWFSQGPCCGSLHITIL